MEILILLTCSRKCMLNCFSFEARKFERVKTNTGVSSEMSSQELKHYVLKTKRLARQTRQMKQKNT